jgi:S1-C subfamily serine protease
MRSLLAVFAAVIAANAQSPLDSPSIVAKISPAVVLIKGESSSGRVLGSGLIISPDGKIATNLHVIRELSNAGVQLASGEIFDTLSVLAFDDRKDLAIIKIPGFDLPTVELGNSNDVRSGERVVVIGSPRGLQGTVTTGVVSAVRDDPAGAGFKVIQTDASVNPGNSGGPLLNDRGQAIGVVTYKLRGSEGLNFAVPINYVRGMLESLQKPLSLEELRTSLSSAKPDIFKSSAFPALWKSLSTGNVRNLRFEGDYIYGEIVMTEEQRRLGFATYELKKDGEGYKGVFRSGGTCSYVLSSLTHFDTSTHYNQCKFERQIEFTSVTPNRIEGRGFGPPEGDKLDCRKCSYSKPPVWTPFVWIPQ